VEFGKEEVSRKSRLILYISSPIW